MKSSISSVLYLILVSTLVSSYCSNCEQLSTVFVLEPSDYSSSEQLSAIPAALVSNEENSNGQLNADSSNTRIITDNGDSSTSPASSILGLGSLNNKSSKALSNNQKVVFNNQQHHTSNNNYQQQPEQQQQSSHNLPSRESENKQYGSQTSNHYTISNSNQDRDREVVRDREVYRERDHLPEASSSASSTEELDDAPMSRRLEEESQYPASTRLKTPSTTIKSNIQQPTSAPLTSRPKQYSSSTTNSYTERDHSTPKAEERLLISITSDEDDYKPMKVQGGGSLLPSGAGPRQPSITISIQDNAKQSGGSLGGQGSAVILRPTENGHIVISTVGGAQLATSQLSVNPNQKPTGGFAVISPSGNGNHHIISTGNNNNNREPLEVPIQSSSNAYTSTYRPVPLGNERPITSTLIDQPRPPVNIGGGERPQRPIDEQRPPHRPNMNEERPVRLPVNQQQGLDNERPPRPNSLAEESNYDLRPPTQRPTLSRPINQPDPTAFDNEDLNNNNNNNNNRPINNQQLGPPESKYPLSEKNCGLVHETRIVGGEEANPDDFLWMAAIIKSKPVNGEARPFCGGSLITRRHILTAAHCLENLAPRDVLVRLGSYDFDDSTASSLSADYAIDQFRVPASYSKKTHASDIAIMRLKTPLSVNDNYKTVCMPQPRRSYVGALATVTGYGSQSQTFRRAAPKLRQVTVPVWENRKCAVVYKKNLTDSFLCAGYEEGGKDACQGDSGGPLMTEGPGERMMVIGVVSHGIGCGSPGYPGVYTRTTTYLDWIEKNTRE